MRAQNVLLRYQGYCLSSHRGFANLLLLQGTLTSEVCFIWSGPKAKKQYVLLHFVLFWFIVRPHCQTSLV